jgi:SAM-dependent methyltransferase
MAAAACVSVRTVAAREVRAISFGQVAGDYDRLRPGPPETALDWLVPPDCEIAVDLGAGTGLFTRALERRARRVIAVEPDERMRAVLAARSPAVQAVAGRGEAIPLPDGCVDGIFVSSAWHWLDPGTAVPEIARVLRDGGRLGVIWTSRDRRTDWLAGLGMFRGRGSRPAEGTGSAADVQAGRGGRGHEVTLPQDAPFVNVATASFTFTRSMTVDDAVDWLGTYSSVITAPEGERDAGLSVARDALARRADENGMVEIPMQSACWRADRVRRSGAGTVGE